EAIPPHLVDVDGRFGVLHGAVLARRAMVPVGGSGPVGHGAVPWCSSSPGNAKALTGADSSWMRFVIPWRRHGRWAWRFAAGSPSSVLAPASREPGGRGSP